MLARGASCSQRVSAAVGAGVGVLLPTLVDALAADATGSPPVGVGVLQGTTGVRPLFISIIACRLHTFEGVCVGVGVEVGVVVGVRV